MRQAQNGDTVRIHYTGTLEDGTVFDSSRQRDPLEFTLGQGKLIPGFETGVIGMTQGAKKTVTIAPEDGYGEHHEAMVATIDRSDIPEDLKPEIGQQLQVSRPDGKTFNVILTGMDETSITVDANHPLAGKTLKFELELVEFA